MRRGGGTWGRRKEKRERGVVSSRGQYGIPRQIGVRPTFRVLPPLNSDKTGTGVGVRILSWTVDRRELLLVCFRGVSGRNATGGPAGWETCLRRGGEGCDGRGREVRSSVSLVPSPVPVGTDLACVRPSRSSQGRPFSPTHKGPPDHVSGAGAPSTFPAPTPVSKPQWSRGRSVHHRQGGTTRSL